jgi:DNA polymerase elongation subunit (family B)
MSYVDAFHDWKANVIRVVERNSNQERVIQTYPANHTFYVENPKGKYRSIYDTPLIKIKCKSLREVRAKTEEYPNAAIYESDLNPVFVCLSEHYIGLPAPKLNVAFWDIETDFDPIRGYSSPEEAFLPITAISIYLQWLNQLITLAVPPKTLTMEQAKRAIAEFPDTYLFNNDAQLLDVFLSLIEDADVLSGWNSESYDMPFTVNRITRVLSKPDTTRLCLLNQYPRTKPIIKYGKKETAYELVGRVHLDSLNLYKKYTYEERHSNSLDAIAQYELQEQKVPYQGTLDDLYNKDFPKFIKYSRQDTAILHKLDRKLQFIDLANHIAHDNTVLLPTTLGAVAVTEQAIINEAHSRGMRVPNRKVKELKFDEEIDPNEDTHAAAGAYVAHPKVGLHDWVGAVDLKSLYPSVLRALNMGPETIIGQLRQTATEQYIQTRINAGMSFAAAWEGIFGSLEYTALMNKEPNTMLWIDWANNESTQMTAANAYKLIFESNLPWIISANGTIFTHEKEGVVPGLLKRWYTEREHMQATKTLWIEFDAGISIPDKLAQKLSAALAEIQ